MEYSPHSEEAKAKQKPLKVAINGFGRMGRIFTRLAWDNPRFIIVAINSRSDADIYAHILKYDSIYGPWDYGVAHDGNEALVIDGKRIPLHHEADVAKAPWRQYDIDVVIESTGVFRDRESSQKHIDAGAKYVAITAPAKDVDATLLYGINHREFDAKNHRVFSCASCTGALPPRTRTPTTSIWWIIRTRNTTFGGRVRRVCLSYRPKPARQKRLERVCRSSRAS